MKLEHQDIRELGNQVVIRELQIGDKLYDLIISSMIAGRVTLEFSDATGARFGIRISEHDKLSFSRDCLRPSHDHDDNEYLIDTTLPNGERKTYWSNRFPHSPGQQFHEVDFGPITSPF